jgi:hypothetical protein
MTDTASLRMTGQRRLGWQLCQEVHHQEGSAHIPSVMLLMVSSRGHIGVKAHTLGWSHRACNPHEFRILGRVGQESHRRPAVLEVAALRSVAFRLVPLFDESQILGCVVFHIVPARSTALLPNLLTQAYGNRTLYQEADLKFERAWLPLRLPSASAIVS